MKVLKLCQAQRRVVFASCGIQLLQKSKFLSVFVLLFVLAASTSTFAQEGNKYSGGKGTKADPYKISTPQDLVALSNLWNSKTSSGHPTSLNYTNQQHYVLTNDIDMSGITNFTPIGNSYLYNDASGNFFDKYEHGFNGVFDGKGYTIRNLTITKTVTVTTVSNVDYMIDGHAGLFGLVNNKGHVNNPDYRGAVRNITLENANITTTLQPKNNNCNSTLICSGVGAVVGTAAQGVTVENCSVLNSKIVATSTCLKQDPAYNGNVYYSNVGAVAGAFITGGNGFQTTVTNSTSIGNTVIGGTNVGGVLGSGDPSQGSIDGYTIGGNSVTATLKNGTVAKTGPVIGAAPGYPAIVIPDEKESWAYSLVVGKWNFVGSFGETFNQMNSNSGGHGTGDYLDFSSGYDLRALGFDYKNNTWGTHYKMAANNMNLGEGYFVWPFGRATLKSTKDYLLASGKDTNNITEGLELVNEEQIIDGVQYVTINASRSWLNSKETVDISGIKNTASADGAKWFALSNPFSLPIDVTKLFTKGITNAQGNTAYVYDAKTSSWKTNLDGDLTKIAPCKGFFVASEAESLTGSLNKDIKVSSTVSGKSSVSNSLMTFVTSTKDGLQHKSFAKYNEQASDNFDGYDAYSLFSDNENMVEMYFNVNDRKVLSNNFAQLPYETEINFRALAEKEVTLSANNIPSGMEVSVVDVENSTETILNDADFTFNANEGDNTGKYKIRFSMKNSVSDVAQADVRVFNDNNTINIYGNGLQNVEVMNTLGQVVYNKEISGDSYNFTLNANGGAYVVKVKTANGNKVEKIIVK